MGKIMRGLMGGGVIIALVLLGLGAANAEDQNFEITLTILNPADEQGGIYLVQGDSVEVEYLVDDPYGQLSRFDLLRLVREDNGQVVSIKRRGIV